MKNLGYLLITFGFLMGSYYSVLDTENVQWSMAGAGLTIGVIGVVLARVATRSQSSAAETLRTNIGKLEESLTRIVEKIEILDNEKESINVYEVHHRIDHDFMEDLDIFVDNRESIGHAYGLQSYADVMTHFATAERYLNRCWSASSDGYVDEVNRYISRSRDQFTQALDLLRNHTAQAGSRPL